MEVYYFNANLLARTFVFSVKNSFLYTLPWGSLSHETEMQKLSANEIEFRCTKFLVMWHPWKSIHVKCHQNEKQICPFNHLFTTSNFLWEIKILSQYMKITHDNFCFWQHLATVFGISVLKKRKKKVSIVKIMKFIPLQNT